MAKKVTPISPKRSKGRPSRVQQQIINLERKIFTAREKIIDAQPEAIETIYELMKNKDAPPQVRLSSAKEVLGYGAALYQELVESELENEQDTPTNEVTPAESEEQNETNVIDWGDFGSLKQN